MPSISDPQQPGGGIGSSSDHVPDGGWRACSGGAGAEPTFRGRLTARELEARNAAAASAMTRAPKRPEDAFVEFLRA